MVVSLVAEQQLVDWLGDLISAQEIVHVANTIFLQDQVRKILFFHEVHCDHSILLID